MIRRLLFAAATLLGFAAAAAPLTAQPDSGPSSLVLRPGDVIRVVIWREEDLSGEFLVDETGRVVLPLIGERQVAGVPVGRLRDDLLEAYRVQLRNPSISITPLRRVSILGEVQRAGQYAIDPTVSLVGAVAQAGGATPNGDLNRVSVVRRGQVIRERVRPGASLDALDVQSGDDIYVGRRGWFDRNSGTVLGAVISIVGGVISALILINNNN